MLCLLQLFPFINEGHQTVERASKVNAICHLGGKAVDSVGISFKSNVHSVQIRDRPHEGPEHQLMGTREVSKGQEMAWDLKAYRH